MLQRNTRQRKVILEELKRFRNHPTAAMLYKSVKEVLPKISLGTIYRNLDQLEKAGYIKKIELSGNEARYDGTVTDHYHIRCIQCGRIDDIYGVDLHFKTEEKQGLEGYKLEGFSLELKGVCPECNLNQKTY